MIDPVRIVSIFLSLFLLTGEYNDAFALSVGSGSSTSSKPTLVVGATGKVGRLVVQQLLEAKKPVKALVRDEAKAKELFQQYTSNNDSDSDSDSDNDNDDSHELEIIVCDLGKYQDPKQRSIIENAINGVDAIISVSGTMRISKLMDFIPPWKLLNEDISSWCDDTSHPYYTNYKAQCLMVDIAASQSQSQQNKPPKFIRLTGLSTGFSTFNFFTLIFSSILSLSSRYHYLFEQYLRSQDKVPYIILRPGGLADEDRDPDQTYLQVEPSGYLPPPGRIPRSDVASFAVHACDASIIPSDSSYTLGIRAVGEMRPKPQGEREDGYASAKECLQKLVDSTPPEKVLDEMIKKPYGVAVGLFVYTLATIGFVTLNRLVQFIFNLLKN